MFYPCLKCSKQTNSHEVLEGMVYLCHTCFLAMPPAEFEELKEKHRMDTAKVTIKLAEAVSQSLLQNPRIAKTIAELKERRKNG